MRGQVDDLQKQLRRYRLSASLATQEASNLPDPQMQQSYVALAGAWTVQGDDLERKLNGGANTHSAGVPAESVSARDDDRA